MVCSKIEVMEVLALLELDEALSSYVPLETAAKVVPKATEERPLQSEKDVPKAGLGEDRLTPGGKGKKGKKEGGKNWGKRRKKGKIGKNEEKEGKKKPLMLIKLLNHPKH